MKIFGAFATIHIASAQNTFWPAASYDQTCGAVKELSMRANATCVVKLEGENDLEALWVNAGGSFITETSMTRNEWRIHTYEGHGEDDGVRFVAWFKIPEQPKIYKYEFNNPKYYPERLESACGMPDPVSYIDIDCADTTTDTDGLFMAAFSYAPGNNNGTYAIPVINTAGHKENNFYSFELKNHKYEGVSITDIEVMANATVMEVDLDEGKFGVMLTENYNGELLYINFRNADPENMGFFDGAQAFYSFIN